MEKTITLPAIRLKLLLSIFIFTMLFSNCTSTETEVDKVEPLHFKTQIPLTIYKEKMFILTEWGKFKVKQSLLFDTHAPSSGGTYLLNNNNSIRKINNLFYKINTFNGTEMGGAVYTCDSIRLGSVKFDSVIIYDMPNILINNWNESVTGVFGDNLISRGIWKIDFKNSLLTFASNIDSIEGLQNASKIPSSITDNIISVDAFFLNRIHHKASVDFGYSGSVIMPIKQFKEIDIRNNAFVDTQNLLLTSSGFVRGNIYRLLGEIKINNSYFNSEIASNESVKETLLGLGFFSHFEFIVLDYKNNSLYISKKIIKPFPPGDNYP